MHTHECSFVFVPELNFHVRAAPTKLTLKKRIVPVLSLHVGYGRKVFALWGIEERSVNQGTAENWIKCMLVFSWSEIDLLEIETWWAWAGPVGWWERKVSIRVREGISGFQISMLSRVSADFCLSDVWFQLTQCINNLCSIYAPNHISHIAFTTYAQCDKKDLCTLSLPLCSQCDTLSGSFPQEARYMHSVQATLMSPHRVKDTCWRSRFWVLVGANKWGQKQELWKFICRKSIPPLFLPMVINKEKKIKEI